MSQGNTISKNLDYGKLYRANDLLCQQIIISHTHTETDGKEYRLKRLRRHIKPLKYTVFGF